MINKFSISHLRNAEHFAFMIAANDVLSKYPIIDEDPFHKVYNDFCQLLKTAAEALKLEEKNEKIREKNNAEHYRDKLHSKLFNYLKSILYDEKDSRFDTAQQLMKIVKEVGNPTRLPENAESVVITKLGNSLEPHRRELINVGADKIFDDLLNANQQFIVLEKECREVTAAHQLNKIQPLSIVRKQIDPVYLDIVNYINLHSRISSIEESYRELITKMNVLVAKYEAILMARKKNKE
jgi:hypothetical protein